MAVSDVGYQNVIASYRLGCLVLKGQKNPQDITQISRSIIPYNDFGQWSLDPLYCFVSNPATRESQIDDLLYVPKRNGRKNGQRYTGKNLYHI